MYFSNLIVVCAAMAGTAFASLGELNSGRAALTKEGLKWILDLWPKSTWHRGNAFATSYEYLAKFLHGRGVDKDDSYMIIDLRNQAEYDQFHLQCETCIHFLPEEFSTSGKAADELWKQYLDTPRVIKYYIFLDSNNLAPEIAGRVSNYFGSPADTRHRHSRFVLLNKGMNGLLAWNQKRHMPGTTTFGDFLYIARPLNPRPQPGKKQKEEPAKSDKKAVKPAAAAPERKSRGGMTEPSDGENKKKLGTILEEDSLDEEGSEEFFSLDEEWSEE